MRFSFLLALRGGKCNESDCAVSVESVLGRKAGSLVCFESAGNSTASSVSFDGAGSVLLRTGAGG